ncbi:hypothetical protein [Lentibacillus sp. CBA3610]|uniref:hypothetical protein n=1 Tax=Lentibacillus sp. CBA3610 TaxID=2518176 RepID=UPI00159510A9|nr:hypothetical protein [Lentibacillus sp. CBA3610]QKY69855.1 hypothetical protein Len3610_09855 [Lentibacillus sp. CBA3610]
MENPMKRKQYHMTNEDDKTVKDLAASKGWSEAEVVREAIREYSLKERQKSNPLLVMADNAEKYSVDFKRCHHERTRIQRVFSFDYHFEQKLATHSPFKIL